MPRIIFALMLCVAVLGARAQTPPAAPAADAPDRYVVQQGDTLWSIARRFLADPWRWPQLWRLNRDEVANPHLIYPGQVLVFDRASGTLSVAESTEPPLQKLSPRIITSTSRQAIPSIPPNLIEPFLVRPVVSDQAKLDSAATVVAIAENQVIASMGDTIFAKDLEPGTRSVQIYRRTTPLIDPVSKAVLGHEAMHLGHARVIEQRDDGLSTLMVTSAIEEIQRGDRMLPAERPALLSYIPRAPGLDVEGRVVSIYGGMSETGQGSVIALNLGEGDGLQPGHVLALYRNRGDVLYTEDGNSERITLPEARYGLVFVFRVFDKVAYGLIMESKDAVRVGDMLRSPNYRE